MALKRIVAGLGIVLVAGVFFCGTGWSSERVTITGSTSLLPLAQRAAEVYMRAHPQVHISVAGRGSADGTRSILDRTSDLAGASRELKPLELSLAKQRGISLLTHPVALGGVVPVVDKRNPVQNLSSAQLRDIYSGKITNWRELGGPNLTIAVINRDSNSGTLEVFRKVVMGKRRIRPDALMMASNGAMVQAVAGNRAAIGYVSIAYLNPRIKALKVDGLAASPRSVLDGSYPLARTLYLLTPGRPQGAVKDFLDFLRGPAGRQIVRQEGFIPLPR